VNCLYRDDLIVLYLNASLNRGGNVLYLNASLNRGGNLTLNVDLHSGGCFNQMRITSIALPDTWLMLVWFVFGTGLC
jgi:hypothetical protein